MSVINTCHRTGLPHSYWPQGNCQYCGEISPVLASLTSELNRLREALTRQSDNMAFVINHHSMHDSWYEKFQRELEEDRAALNPRGAS